MIGIYGRITRLNANVATLIRKINEGVKRIVNIGYGFHRKGDGLLSRINHCGAKWTIPKVYKKRKQPRPLEHKIVIPAGRGKCASFNQC